MYRFISLYWLVLTVGSSRCPEKCECRSHDKLYVGLTYVGKITCINRQLTNEQLMTMQFPSGYEALVLKNNRLTTFPQTFENTSFRYIGLSHNRISKLPTFIPSLEVIDLGNNLITGKLSSANFSSSYSNISTIFMDYNKITEVAPDTFKRLLNLVSFSFYGNKLTQLNGAGSESQKLGRIDLRKNNIDCSMTQVGFCKHVQSKTLRFSDGMCASPAGMAGKVFRDALTPFCNLCYKDGKPWCANNGACAANYSSYTAECNCTSGFIGQRCQQQQPLETTLAPKSSATRINAFAYLSVTFLVLMTL